MTTDTIIAVSALALSVYGLYATRRHDRLSVKPVLSVVRGWHADDNGLRFQYQLVNQGLGPAKVTRFVLLLDGNEFSPRTQRPIAEFAATVITRPFRLLESNHASPGFHLIPETPFTVANVYFHGAKSEDQDGFEEMFKRTHIRVEFESIYKQKGYFDSRE